MTSSANPEATAASPEPWAAPPAIPGPWKDLTDQESTALAARLGASVAQGRLGGIATVAALRRIRAVPLSFYRNWLLIECAASLPGDGEGVVSFLYGPGTRIVLLDLTSTPIHDVNAMAPLLALDDDGRAKDYLRFFCAHIVGDEGRFRIVERVADVVRADGAPPGEPGLIHPVDRVPWTDPDRPEARRYRANVLYGSKLYRSVFELDAGEVTMVEDEVLCPIGIREEVIAPPFRIVRSAGSAGSMRSEGDPE